LSVRLAAVVLGRHSLAAESGASPPRSRNRVFLLLWKNMAVAGVYWGLAALVQWYFSRYQM
jgi:hypothetical protein